MSTGGPPAEEYLNDNDGHRIRTYTGCRLTEARQGYLRQQESHYVALIGRPSVGEPELGG